MHWYQGSIAEAVALSKQRNTVFVVFVEGDNDLSSEMATTIDDSDVLKRLSDPDNFLAVKLKSGSANYTHFAQIYQFVPVPSLFFIGRNGTPLEVVCAGVEPSNLANRIDRILEEHHKDKPASAAGNTGDVVRQQTVELLRAEGGAVAPVAAPPTPRVEGKREAEPETSVATKIQKTEHNDAPKSAMEYEVVCKDDVCIRVPKVRADGSGPSSASQPTLQESQKPTEPVPTDVLTEDKIEKAKELIEARRREKAAKEKELEKQKELERRAVGQGVTELKKWQADQELKQIQEERRREKMENNLARQRILEQIAQDRAERRARDAPPQPVLQQQTNTPTSGDIATGARIQFKLPDGGSHTAHFDADDTLGDVQEYVADNLQLSPSNFSLWTAFPRRELSERSATLRDLQLSPSAALLVLPRRHHDATVANQTAFTAVLAYVTQFISTFVLLPSRQLFQWLRERLYPPTPSVSPDSSESSLDSASPSTAAPQSPLNMGGVRRRGNIHRLGEDRTNDDDNNTWNGNSTQQM